MQRYGAKQLPYLLLLSNFLALPRCSILHYSSVTELQMLKEMLI